MALSIGSKDVSSIHTTNTSPGTEVGGSKQADTATAQSANPMPPNQDAMVKASQQQAKEAASMQGLASKLRNQELQAKLDGKGTKAGQPSLLRNPTALAFSGGPYTVNLPLGSTKKFTADDLTLSAGSGKLAEVEILLGMGIDINEKDSHGMNALMRAAEAGNKDMMQLLIDRGAAVEARSDSGKTPLFIAAENGRADAIKFLVDNNAYVDQPAENGMKPLMAAAASGSYEAVQALIGAGARTKASSDNNSRTPLMYAADGKGNAKVVQALIDAGVPVDKQDKWGRSALMDAARYANKEVVETLLKNKAKLNLKDDDDRTALIAAVRPANRPMTGKMEVIQMLLDAKADANIKDKDGLNALFYATQVRDIKIPVGLATATKDIDLQEKKTGRTALMEAAQNGHTEIVKELIRKKANLSIQDNDKQTALTSAIGNGDVESVRALVAAGAKLNMPGADAMASAKSLKQTSSHFEKEADQIIKILEDAVAAQKKKP